MLYGLGLFALFDVLWKAGWNLLWIVPLCFAMPAILWGLIELFDFLCHPRRYMENRRKEKARKLAEMEADRKAFERYERLRREHEEALERAASLMRSGEYQQRAQQQPSAPPRPVNHGKTLFDYGSSASSSSSGSGQKHRNSVSPWEGYARQSDREQGWYCNHDHHSSECDD